MVSSRFLKGKQGYSWHLSRLAFLQYGRYNRERRRAWTISDRRGCPVVRLTSSFRTWWYHLIPNNFRKHHCNILGNKPLNSGSWLKGQEFDITVQFDSGLKVNLSQWYVYDSVLLYSLYVTALNSVHFYTDLLDCMHLVVCVFQVIKLKIRNRWGIPVLCFFLPVLMSD